MLILCPQILSGEYRALTLRRANQRIILQALWPFLRRRPFVFLTNTPFGDFIRSELRPQFTGYDLIDDFCAFRQFEVFDAAFVLFGEDEREQSGFVPKGG